MAVTKLKLGETDVKRINAHTGLTESLTKVAARHSANAAGELIEAPQII